MIDAGWGRWAPILCGSLLATSTTVAAQEGGITVSEVRAQAFLERSGRFSDDLSGGGKRIWKNLAFPTGDLGEASTGVLVTLIFAGPKNTESSRNLARDMAQVTVKQTKEDATRTLLFRAYGGFAFGESGLAHKAFLLDDATCAPLEIDVKIGRSRRTETLDLQCDAPRPAEASTPARPAKEGRSQR
jgi:hypothetical protein